MLLFHRAGRDIDIDTVKREGLRPNDGRDLPLHLTLEEAEQTGNGPIFVVDSTKIDGRSWDAPDSTVRVSGVGPAAIRNADPYRRPQPVTAAGGYVVRVQPDGIALLVIFRRGVWDLPKGGKAAGESIETCAGREVREEIGVDHLDILRPLGTTQHDYDRDGVYAVKTTHWYLMQTSERSFEPGEDEGIEDVRWARWPEARQNIGYDTLRRHMDKVEADVRAAVGE